MALTLELDNESREVDIASRRPQLTLEVDGHRCRVVERAAENGGIEIEVNGHRHFVYRLLSEDRIYLWIDGQTFSIGYADAIAAAKRAAGGDNDLRADMPGMVVSAHCNPGQSVESGTTLLVIESMKMQVNVIAPRSATVKEVHVVEAQAFERGAVLVSLEPEADE